MKIAQAKKSKTNPITIENSPRKQEESLDDIKVELPPQANPSSVKDKIPPQKKLEDPEPVIQAPIKEKDTQIMAPQFKKVFKEDQSPIKVQ